MATLKKDVIKKKLSKLKTLKNDFIIVLKKKETPRKSTSKLNYHKIHFWSLIFLLLLSRYLILLFLLPWLSLCLHCFLGENKRLHNYNWGVTSFMYDPLPRVQFWLQSSSSLPSRQSSSPSQMCSRGMQRLLSQVNSTEKRIFGKVIKKTSGRLFFKLIKFRGWGKASDPWHGLWKRILIC